MWTVGIFLLFTAVRVTNSVDKYDSDWDLNYPCRDDIEKLAKAHSEMASCASTYSSPPAVCSNCFTKFINLKHAEYKTHHLDDLFSIDNKSCSTVIYSNYLLSYANQLTTSMTKGIWESSRCSSCLSIHWDFEHMNSTVRFDDKTTRFQTLLEEWRECVTNTVENTTAPICESCGRAFDTLFDYYWKIYTEPRVEFCLDVETTMNDTMNIWHNVWLCQDDPRPIDRHNDVLVVVFSATLLGIVIALFYASAYIQTEHAQTNLIQYSRLVAPSSTRYRLLSSSNSHDSPNLYTTSSNSSFYG